MTKITNISNGPRGFWCNGELVVLAAGETIGRDLKDGDLAGVKGNKESFELGAKGEKIAEEQKTDDLKEQAESLGIKVDGRWSDERIQQEIDKKLAE